MPDLAVLVFPFFSNSNIDMVDPLLLLFLWPPTRLDMGVEQQRERRDLEPTGPPDRTYKVGMEYFKIFIRCNTKPMIAVNMLKKTQQEVEKQQKSF